MWRAVLFLLLITPAAANECLSYKITPNITVSAPDWSKEVVQPLKPMDLLHGNVVATLVDNYDITADITSIEDGFCIALKTVDATIGYADFTVQIDMRHTPQSCTYNAILSHEDEHIRAYLSIMDDFSVDVYKSLFSAANSVMPIFVRNSDEMDRAVDILNETLQSHPDLILIKQQISAAEEIRNKGVDEREHGQALKQCL